MLDSDRRSDSMIRLPTEVKRMSSSHELSIVPGILPLAIASDMAACHMIVDYIDPTLIFNHLTYRTYQMEHAAGQGGRCSGHMSECLNSRSVHLCQHLIATMEAITVQRSSGPPSCCCRKICNPLTPHVSVQPSSSSGRVYAVSGHCTRTRITSTAPRGSNAVRRHHRQTSVGPRTPI